MSSCSPILKSNTLRCSSSTEHTSWPSRWIILKLRLMLDSVALKLMLSAIASSKILSHFGTLWRLSSAVSLPILTYHTSAPTSHPTWRKPTCNSSRRHLVLSTTVVLLSPRICNIERTLSIFLYFALRNLWTGKNIFVQSLEFWIYAMFNNRHFWFDLLQNGLIEESSLKASQELQMLLKIQVISHCSS